MDDLFRGLAILQKEGECDNVEIGKMMTLAENMRKSQREKYLKEHQYKVWQGKNLRWLTYLPDETKKDNRRLVSKATRDEILESIIAYYDKEEQTKQRKQITLFEIYEEWLAYKAVHVRASSYIRRIDNDWVRYYLKDEIVNKKIKDLDFLYLDTWCHNKIKELELTKKQYYNMTVIIRQILDYTVNKEIIEENPMDNIKINPKLFKPERKKEDKTQVYLIEEQPILEKAVLTEFEEKKCTIPLAILFAFQTGVRIGEIVGLRWGDVDEEFKNYMLVQRQEVRDEKRNKDGTWQKTSLVVVEYTKSDAGHRNVFLTSFAREILEMVRKQNEADGFSNDGYIFLQKNGKRATKRMVDNRLRKCCKRAGVPEKSMHKIRKTYISTLIDNDVNINTIRALVGHEDERTTYHNYCFNRKSEEQIQVELEKALVSKCS